MGDGERSVECSSCGKATIIESEQEANQEVTHCEWCSAEYTVPEDEPDRA